MHCWLSLWVSYTNSKAAAGRRVIYGFRINPATFLRFSSLLVCSIYVCFHDGFFPTSSDLAWIVTVWTLSHKPYGCVYFEDSSDGKCLELTTTLGIFLILVSSSSDATFSEENEGDEGQGDDDDFSLIISPKETWPYVWRAASRSSLRTGLLTYEFMPT